MSRITVPESIVAALRATAVVSGAALLGRALIGPFTAGPVSVNSPMNAQSIFGLSCLLLFALAVWRERKDLHRNRDHGHYPGLPAVLVLTGIAFLPALSVGLLADDHWWLLDAGRYVSQFPWQQGDDFLRPIGVLLYALAGYLRESMWLVHLVGVLLHLVTTALVFQLARRIAGSGPAALVAASVFALHGSRPGAVVWVSGWVEVLAALFLMAACLAYLNDQQSPSRSWMTICLLSGFLAMWSKETGFVFPLLLTLLALWHGDRRPRVLMRLAWAYGLTATLFLYRWHSLGGIGGYEDSFRILGFVKVYALRLWAGLFFPLNWSLEPAWTVSLCLAAGILAYVLLSRHAPTRWPAALAIGFLLVAALPASSQLLIGPDLEKSRLLYLPSVGFSLLLGLTVGGIPARRYRTLAAGALILFHLGLLQHNLAIWNRASRLSEEICGSTAGVLEADTRHVVALDLPRIWNGVYLFQHGFKECVDRHLAHPLESVFVGAAASVPPALRTQTDVQWFQWQPAQDRLLQQDRGLP